MAECLGDLVNLADQVKSLEQWQSEVKARCAKLNAEAEKAEETIASAKKARGDADDYAVDKVSKADLYSEKAKAASDLLVKEAKAKALSVVSDAEQAASALITEAESKAKELEVAKAAVLEEIAAEEARLRSLKEAIAKIAAV